MSSGRRPRAPRIKLVVTEEMIEDAIPRDSGHCVFAEAVKASWPNASKIAVDLQTIRFTDPGKMLRYTYLTPRPVQVALVNFDQGVLPIPFDIQLRNGQVTAAGRKTKPRRPSSPKQAEAARKSAEKAREHRKNLSKATLVVRKEGSVPDKVGGKPPPAAPGRRRAFGLRALER